MTDKPHTVKSFDDALADLDQRIEQMGALSLKLLRDSFTALETANEAEANDVIAADAKIDALEKEVDVGGLTLIALRQPLAEDLRHVAAAMKISGDLERIGDLAKNIAKRALAIGGEHRFAQQMRSLNQLVGMAESQLRDVLRAYSQRDAKLARSVWQRDAALDAQHQALFRELLTYMMEDPRNITSCAQLLFVAKNIERIGDHTTNIAEKIHFMVTGDDLPEDRPRGPAVL